MSKAFIAAVPLTLLLVAAVLVTVFATGTLGYQQWPQAKLADGPARTVTVNVASPAPRARRASASDAAPPSATPVQPAAPPQTLAAAPVRRPAAAPSAVSRQATPVASSPATPVAQETEAPDPTAAPAPAAPAAPVVAAGHSRSHGLGRKTRARGI